MKRVCFVVPCHGRHAIASACLRQLAATCAVLAPVIVATAVLISNEPVFRRLADEVGFTHVEQTNKPLGRKWNDGFEVALGELAADYVIPFGSDDVVDARLISTALPSANVVRCSRTSTVVSENGKRLAHLNITYAGGDGVRTMPASMLQRVGCRPIEDHRDRAMDTSIQRTLDEAGVRRTFDYVDLHPLQIVDFKSSRCQLNSYAACAKAWGTHESSSVWDDLAAVYPAGFVDEMQRVYATGGSRR